VVGAGSAGHNEVVNVHTALQQKLPVIS